MRCPAPTAGILNRGRSPRPRAARIDMLAFVQFLEELATDHVTLTPAEVQRMRDRFGDKTLQMGHFEDDGSLSIPDHPNVADGLNNLAELSRSQGQHEQAEPLYRRSLAIREKALGPDHPDVAATLNNMAVPFGQTGREKAAEELARRAAVIFLANKTMNRTLNEGKG